MKKLLAYVFITLSIMSVVYYSKYKTTIYYIEQTESISKAKTDIQNLKKAQIMTISILEEIVNQLTPDDSGQASYYDYTLKDGWSSKGHRVCASRTFERGATIRVVNVYNGKWVDCLVTDYGPDASMFPDRVVDLSSFAFSQIADLHQGVVTVAIKEIK